MKFLVDAQLPNRLSELLKALGHDSVHTLDLPDGNWTADADLNRLSMAEGRTLITKDADFVDSMVQQGKPYKLLLVSTGNIGNTDGRVSIAGLCDCSPGAAQRTQEHAELRLNVLVAPWDEKFDILYDLQHGTCSIKRLWRNSWAVAVVDAIVPPLKEVSEAFLHLSPRTVDRESLV